MMLSKKIFVDYILQAGDVEKYVKNLQEKTLKKRFVEYHLEKLAYNSSEMEKIYDKNLANKLFEVYKFAYSNKLTFQNVLHCHKIFSVNLDDEARGQIRKYSMPITDDNFKVTYIACNKDKVESEIKKLFAEIDKLLSESLTIKEIFYYASMIHLYFYLIHPFEDGNSRTARLVEKWFLKEKIGQKAFVIPSEKYYLMNIQNYYDNIHKVSINYEKINILNALPFLLMLIRSFKLGQLQGLY